MPRSRERGRGPRPPLAGRGPAVLGDGARVALLGLFAITGLTVSAWVARLPAMRDALSLSPAQLGTVLLAMAFGALASMAVASDIALRLGQRRSVRLTGGLFAVAYGTLALAAALGSVPLAVGGLFVHGVAFAGGNLVLNVASTEVERRVGRPILPQFHAAFSIGTVLGALTGAAAAAAGTTVVAQLVALAVLAVAWRWVAARHLPGESAPSHASAWVRRAVVRSAGTRPDVARPDVARPVRPRREPPAGPGSLAQAWREPRTLTIGVIILAAMIAEGGAMDWVALATVDGLGAAQSVGAVALGLFVGAMTVVRLAGSRIIARLGRVRTLRAGAATSLAGVVVFVLAPSLPVAALGVLAWGAGCALNFPIVVSAASDDPARAAHRVAVVSAFAAAAMFVEPAGLGALAERVGIRSSLTAVAAVLVVILVAARRTAPLAPPASQRPVATLPPGPP